MSVPADMRKALGLFALLALLWLPSAGCSKKSAQSEAPADYGAAEAERAGEGDPLVELDALEDRMQALGLPVASPAAKADAAGQPAVGEGDGEAAAGAGVESEAEPEADVAELAADPEPADASPPSGPTREQRRNRCADMCSLSESICSLEVRICTLSESHAEDPVYADACERAIEDCDVAGEACDSCHG